MTSRIERKQENTRQKIVELAIGLFKERGYEATTMEEIAQAVDIAKGTLYKHFPSKEAILSAYIQNSFRQHFPERLIKFRELPDTYSRFIHIMSELMERVRLQSELFEKFLTYRTQQLLSLRLKPAEESRSGFSLLALEIVRMGQNSGELREDLPLEMMTDFFEFSFVEVAKQFYMQGENFDAQTSIEQAASLFMNGTSRKA